MAVAQPYRKGSPQVDDRQSYRLSDFVIASPASPSLTLFFRSCVRPLAFGDEPVEGLGPSDLDWATGGGRAGRGAVLEDEDPTGDDVFARRWSRALRARALK